MMDAMSLAGEIVGVAKKIYDQVQLVKANKAQCQGLADRVKLIEASIKDLNNLSEQTAFQESLHSLKGVLDDIYVFIEQFANEKRWFRKMLKAGNHHAQFEAFHEALFAPIQQLNLGLNAQQILTQAKDKEDQVKDNASFLKNQETIIKLSKQALGDVNLIKAYQEEVLARQLTSIKMRISDLSQMSERKSKPPLIDPKYTVSSFDLAFDDKIGEGTFGKIFRGRYDDHVVVIKTVDNMQAAELKEFSNEAKLMYQLSHAQIPMFYGANIEGDRGCIVMEYMPEGSLDAYLLSTPALSFTAQLGIAIQIVKGLRYLGQQRVTHGDLRSANILLKRSGENLIAKLSDFGLSRRDGGSLHALDKVTSAYAHSSPELLGGKSIDIRSDIFSAGIVLWELATSKKPFAEVNPTRLLTHLSKKTVAENGVSVVHNQLLGQLGESPLYPLIEQCLQVNPENRPTAAQLQKKLKKLLVPLGMTELFSPISPSSSLSSEVDAEGQGTPKKQSTVPSSPSSHSDARSTTKEGDKAKEAVKNPISPKEPKAQITPKSLVASFNTTEDEATSIVESKSQEAKAGASTHEEQIEHLEMQGAESERSRDYVAAVSYYEEAIGLGSIRGKTNLATLILKGRAGTNDKVRAAQLMKEAGDDGHTRALCSYGMMLHRGDGVARDEKAAFGYFEKAAKVGDPNGMYELARAFELGRGTTENMVMAQSWYEKANATGHNKAGACSARLKAILLAREEALQSVSLSGGGYASNMQSTLFNVSQPGLPARTNTAEPGNQNVRRSHK